jgi:hypothetical protein
MRSNHIECDGLTSPSWSSSSPEPFSDYVEDETWWEGEEVPGKQVEAIRPTVDEEPPIPLEWYNFTSIGVFNVTWCAPSYPRLVYCRWDVGGMQRQ